MTNYRMTISYDGTKYNGWQRQGNTKNTIQEKIENVLSLMCERNIEVFSSGRTDAGVHALNQTVNFKCHTDKDICEIKEYLNHYLPEDILVKDICIADDRFHSRLNAKNKTYEYRIAYEKPDVFIRKYVYYTGVKPDVELMRKASLKLIGTHDFIGFSSLSRSKKSTVRTINSIDITDSEGVVSIVVNGTGFLYNMVRIISGTLYEIGIGKLDIDIIDRVFGENKRQLSGITLPAKGLRLVEVKFE